MTAAITGFGAAVPEPVGQEELWEGFFAAHYRHDRLAHKLFSNSGVGSRHAVADPRREDVSTWSTGRRMQRYVEEATPLGARAVTAALDDAGLAAADVGLLAVVTCTGYATPGIDVQLSRQLGMAADVQRLLVGHMGCYAALPGLGAVADFATVRRRPAVMLCVELTSLHLQPAAPGRLQLDQVVAHALFSDAAAAVVVQPDVGGLRVVDVRAVTDHEHADHMTWDVTDLGFRMGLSPRVPDVLAQHVRGAVTDLLGAHGLGVGDVGLWAVHPGGPKVLDVVRDRLGLTEDDLVVSREVLRDHGNCSSATVLLVLDRLRRRGVAPGSYVVALAFGPGLTLYAVLMRSTT